MKKTSIMAALAAASLSLTSCLTAGSTSTSGTNTSSDVLSGVASAGGDILNNLLGSLLTKTLTQESLYGTWVYQSPEVRFESENLLAKAGGEVAAASIEKKLDSYLSKVGIKQGTTTYTFNKDNTYSITTGGRTISQGTYTFDTNKKTLQMQGSMGLINQTCTVGMDGTNLCFLYDADKMLTVMNSVSSILGQSGSTLGSVASVFGSNYKGMKVGMQVVKK